MRTDGGETLLLDWLAEHLRGIRGQSPYSTVVEEVSRDRKPEEKLSRPGIIMVAGPEVPAPPNDISSRTLWRWVPVMFLCYLRDVRAGDPINDPITKQIERFNDDLHYALYAGDNVAAGGFSARTEFVSSEKYGEEGGAGMPGFAAEYRFRMKRTASGG